MTEFQALELAIARWLYLLRHPSSKQCFGALHKRIDDKNFSHCAIGYWDVACKELEVSPNMWCEISTYLTDNLRPLYGTGVAGLNDIKHLPLPQIADIVEPILHTYLDKRKLNGIG